VSLVLEFIEETDASAKSVPDDVIRNPPSSIDDVYSKILTRVSNQKLAKRLLMILVAAVRPLTLDELNIALKIKDGDVSDASINLKFDIEGTVK